MQKRFVYQLFAFSRVRQYDARRVWWSSTDRFLPLIQSLIFRKQPISAFHFGLSSGSCFDRRLRIQTWECAGKGKHCQKPFNLLFWFLICWARASGRARTGGRAKLDECPLVEHLSCPNANNGQDRQRNKMTNDEERQAGGGREVRNTRMKMVIVDKKKKKKKKRCKTRTLFVATWYGWGERERGERARGKRKHSQTQRPIERGIKWPRLFEGQTNKRRNKKKNWKSVRSSLSMFCRNKEQKRMKAEDEVEWFRKMS